MRLFYQKSIYLSRRNVSCGLTPVGRSPPRASGTTFLVFISWPHAFDSGRGLERQPLGRRGGGRRLVAHMRVLLLPLIAAAVSGQQSTTTEDSYYRASDTCGERPNVAALVTESAVCVRGGMATLPASVQPAGYTADTTSSGIGWGISVRCCNDATPMTCQSDAAGTCFGTAQTWTQADATCAANGLRLCTLAELPSCCGTGCEYDSGLVWTSESCPPPLCWHMVHDTSDKNVIDCPQLGGCIVYADLEAAQAACVSSYNNVPQGCNAFNYRTTDRTTCFKFCDGDTISSPYHSTFISMRYDTCISPPSPSPPPTPSPPCGTSCTDEQPSSYALPPKLLELKASGIAGSVGAAIGTWSDTSGNSNHASSSGSVSNSSPPPSLPSTAPVCRILVSRQESTGMRGLEEWSVNPDDPSASQYSILDQIEVMGRGADGKFQFELYWPDLVGSANGPSQIWKQSSNPVTGVQCGDVEGYEAVDAPYVAGSWAGFQRTCFQPPTYPLGKALLDGTPGTGWWYSVGANLIYQGGLTGPGISVDTTELYVYAPCPSPPPSSSPTPPPPSRAYTYTFTNKDALKTAVQAVNANPASALATYGPVADWDVSGISDMSYLFYISHGLKNFNEDVSSWETSSVTDMRGMFNVRSTHAL